MQWLDRNRKAPQLGWPAVRRRLLMEGVWSMMGLRMFTLSTITHKKSLILGPFIRNGLACYLEAVMCAQLSLIMSSMLRYSNPPRVASQLVSEASLGGDRLDNGVQLSSCSLSPNNTLSPIPLCPLIITLAISMRSLPRCGNDHQGRRLAGKSVGEWVRRRRTSFPLR